MSLHTQKGQIGRKLRIIKFSGQLLQDILRCLPHKNKLFRGMTSDAPADLTLMGFHRQCPWDDTYEFVVGSESFDPVPEGTELPIWNPVITAHYGPGVSDADAA